MERTTDQISPTRPTPPVINNLVDEQPNRDLSVQALVTSRPTSQNAASRPDQDFLRQEMNRFRANTERQRVVQDAPEEAKSSPRERQDDQVSSRSVSNHPQEEEKEEPQMTELQSQRDCTGDVSLGRHTGATGGTSGGGPHGDERSATTSNTNRQELQNQEAISTPPPQNTEEMQALQLAKGTYKQESEEGRSLSKFESLKVFHNQKPQIKKCFSTGHQSSQFSQPDSPKTKAHLSSKSEGLKTQQFSSSRFIPRRSFLDPNSELLESSAKQKDTEKGIGMISAANQDINPKKKEPTISSAFLFEKNAREAHGGHTSNIGNREIHNFIALSTQRISFQNIWAFILLIAHTYNFVTFFFFLGNRGFPEWFWLFTEVLMELLLMFDFLLRFMIRKVDRNTWRTLWLLHELKAVKWYNVILNFLASLPQSLVIILALHNDKHTLHLFGIALLRGLKLTRMREVSTYFKNINLVNKRKKASYASSFFVMYFLLLATHVISMAWMIAGRLEKQRPTWFELVHLDKAPLYQQYVDSTFFVVATMTGLGYGNIVPRTIVEYLTVLVIMIVGASIYANFFANFAVTIYNNNAKQIENAKKLEQAKGFANRRGLEEPLKAKIRYYYNHLSIKFGSLQKRYDLLKELPLSLRTELALYTNADLIQSVKLFQLSEPGFILNMARQLNPCLCLAGDFVLHTGELADQMYFIKKGIVVVLAAPDETQIIAYQGVGEYFGEIGVLIDGKRTAAVKALTTSIFYKINKKPLLNILNRFTFQKRFLLAVAKQRMETSTIEDIEDDFERRDTPQWEEGEAGGGGEEILLRP